MLHPTSNKMTRYLNVPVQLLILIILFLLPTQNTFSQTIQLEVEPNHSTVGFGIPISSFTLVRGKFTDYKINIEYIDKDITKSKITVDIKAASINTGIPDRDQHLQSADFFDVEKFPSITFQSSKIVKFQDQYLAIGEFQMHGVTKEIVLPFEITNADGNTIGFKIRSQINRLDYGVGAEFQHTDMPDFLGKNVNVEIDFWTKKVKKKK